MKSGPGVHRWITVKQLIFAQSKLDETGRMIGGWLRQARSREGVR